MLSEAVLLALAVGGMLSLLLGPLGCFMVWRQMAYFGDAISHAALLGVALALVISVPFTPAIFFVALALAVILTYALRDTRFAADTLLGFLAHGTLALGLLIVALSGYTQVDIEAFLFGDILTLTTGELWQVGALVSIGLILLARFWRGLLLATLDPNLAAVEGHKVMRLNYVLVSLLAATVAVSISLVGVLLITALLIMPAAGARPLARNPLQMAVIAACLSMAAIGIGIMTAIELDAPTGPTIVATSMGLCLITLILGKLRSA